MKTAEWLSFDSGKTFETTDPRIITIFQQRGYNDLPEGVTIEAVPINDNRQKIVVKGGQAALDWFRRSRIFPISCDYKAS